VTPGNGDSSIDAVVARALAAIDRLAELGERVEDEWQYVNDLRTVYRGRLTAVAGDLRGAGPGGILPPATVVAVDTVVEEAGLVTDPHRAIDWLSTLPQVVLLALGADA
jgi:hypothetical protein